MLNSGRRGSRAPDGFGILSVNEQFNQTNYPIPVINSWAISTDGLYNPTDDTALDPAGGQIVVVYGSGFKAGVTVNINGTNISPVTLLDQGRITFTSPANSAASYTMYVSNTDGATAIYVPGLVYSGMPTWNHPAAGSIGSGYETKSVSTLNTDFSATSDSTVTYSIYSGNLPSGVTLNSNGTLSGTLPVTASPTTYSFTVRATDSQKQDTDRSFSVTINPDVVTWVAPSLNGSLTVYETKAFSTPLSATSAAGYGVMYAANTLPTGITLNANTGAFTGYANVVGTTYATLTATANTTGRYANSSSAFVVNQDVVTISSPANNATYSLPVGTANTVTISASSAAGYGVMYTANTLPSGMTLLSSNGYISGTPTTGQTVNTLITATANNTNRVAYSYIYWTVSIASDTYFANTVMLLSANTSNFYAANTFSTDNSNNNTQLTIVGDTRADSFNPYQYGYYSNYFDGSSYLTTSNVSIPSTGQFTLEAWIFTPVSASVQIIYSQYLNTDPNRVHFTIDNNSGYKLSIGHGTAATVWGSTVVPVNQWNHVAWTRDASNTVRIFLNGVLDGSASSYTYTLGQNNPRISGFNGTGTYNFTGYISNLRVSNTCLYTTNFTPSTTPLTSANTTLLLTNQSNKFIDISPTNSAITTNGSPLVKPNNPFGTPYVANTQYYSTYFNGSSDYLYPPSYTAWNPSTNDFCIEAWAYFATTSGDTNYRTIMSNYSGGGYIFGLYNSGTPHVLWYDPGIATNLQGTTALAAGVWYHIAVTRVSGNIRIFLDGKLDAYATGSTYAFGGATPNIGKIPSASQTGYMSGYISNLRCIANTIPSAYSTASTTVGTQIFTPSTSTLTTTSQSVASANVTLLTCQSSSFVDNSTNNFAITNGSTTVKPLAVSPFTPTGYTSNTITNFGSAYFDGTADYMTFPLNASNQFGTNDFTIEFWSYFISRSGSGSSLINNYGTWTSGSLGFFAGHASGDTTKYQISYNGSGFPNLTSTSTIKYNQWAHIAIVRKSGTITLYINGVYEGSFSGGAALNGSGNWTIGTAGDALVGYTVTGYMSDIRITNGTAVYTSNFVPQFTNPLTAVANTNLLTCQTNGPHNNNNFVDSSNNKFAITRNGDVKQGTFTPFSPTGWSNYFDGSSYLSFPNNVGYQFSTSDFTIECWINKPSASNGCVVDVRSPLSAVPYAFYVDGSNYPYFYDGTSYTSTVAITNNTWNHIAVTRASGVLRIFVNGVLGQTVNPYTIALDPVGSLTIGGTAAYSTGYISNLRIIKGTALYTSAFTPSTTPLTAVSGTTLLTCQSNRFKDSSSTAATQTNNGSVSVQAFSPFAPTSVYSPVTHGGSAYLDGSGDYLSVATSSASTPGTGNFTYECWIYPTLSQQFSILNTRSGDTTDGFDMSISTGGKIFFTYTRNVFMQSSDGVVPANAWSHVAVVRNGTTMTGYVNGVSMCTSSMSDNWTSTTFFIGEAAQNASPAIGYIADFRYTKTAVYTGTFTPPILSLKNSGADSAASYANTTNVNITFSGSNTQLMLSSTNSGIIDSTTKNNLQTVGDVKVTRFSPYSANNYGVLFNGSSDYLSLAGATTGLTAGTGDITVEAWVYLNALPASGYWVIDQYSNPRIAFSINSSGQLIQYDWYTAKYTSTSVVSILKWTHVAIVRRSGTWYGYINGVDAGGSAADATNYSSTTAPTIGDNSDSRNYFNGYISNLRVTKSAVYNGAFTPSTTPLTAVANTSILTCQSNKFIDNSTNGYAVTLGGSPKVATNNPFTINSGQSYYFDGTGDYLLLPSNSNVNCTFRTGDFTIEFWAWKSANGANTYDGVIGADANGNATGGFAVELSSTRGFVFYNDSVVRIQSSGVNPNDSAWHHYAVVRSNGTMALYKDGVQLTTAAYSGDLGATPTLRVGAIGGASPGYFNGYISDLRVTKGTARYTSNNTTYLNSGSPYLLR